MPYPSHHSAQFMNNMRMIQRRRKKLEQERSIQNAKKKKNIPQMRIRDEKMNYESKQNTSYIGEFNEQGNAHGEGKYIAKDGHVYQGSWNNGQREGFGIQHWYENNINIATHEGFWKNDKQHGYGTMINHIKNEKQHGFWEDGIYKRRSFRVLHLDPEYSGISDPVKKPRNKKICNVNEDSLYLSKISYMEMIFCFVISMFIVSFIKTSIDSIYDGIYNKK